MSIQKQHCLEKIAQHLTKNHLIIATAESCTGGLLAHTLTNISGSSLFFTQGFITYSNQAKQELLGVKPDTLQQYGAVSPQTAKEMAEGVRNKTQADIGLSTTGIAGPTGGTKEKPVGLVYIGIATAKKTEVQKHHFSTNRLKNKQATVDAVLDLLLSHLIQ